MGPLGWAAKFERSNELLGQLQTDIASFLNSGPYALAEQVRDDEVLYELRLTREPPPKLAVVAGELAHDLRSALDHLAWDLVERNGSSPTRDTSFPVQRERDDQAFARQTRGMSTTHIYAIRALQPYLAERPENDWLLRLHDFNRIDKHRLLHVVALVLRQVKLTIGGREGVGQVRVRWKPEWGWPKFDGVLGGQAIGFDEATQDLVAYIPAPNRIIRLEFPPVREPIAPGAPVRFSAPRPKRPPDSSVEVYPEIALALTFSDDPATTEVAELLRHFVAAAEAARTRIEEA